MQIDGHVHQVNELASYQNAWKRPASNVSMEKNDETKYTKSKKEVAVDVMWATAMVILLQGLCIMGGLCSYSPDYLEP